MTENNSVFEGGCACGDVRYRMESGPLITHCCHCHHCQRQTGASFALNALIEADRVTLLSGDLEMILTPTASGKGQQISRCAKCHVAVWSNYAGFGDKVRFVRAGTLDEGHGLSPDVHIYAASRQPWVILPDEQVSVEEFYKLKEVWSDESRARLRRLLESVS